MQQLSENTQFPGFLFAPGSAEALVRCGGKIKYIFIAYFLGNIYVKNCRNRTVYVKGIIASCKGGTFFETHCSPPPQSITALWPAIISRPAEGRRLSWRGYELRNADILSSYAACGPPYSRPGPARPQPKYSKPGQPLFYQSDAHL